MQSTMLCKYYSSPAIVQVCSNSFLYMYIISVLDDDDVELLDLIARTGGDLRQSRPLTGSSAKEPTSHDYSLAG